MDRYAINMCIVQMGEHTDRIKALDEKLDYDRDLFLKRKKVGI